LLARMGYKGLRMQVSTGVGSNQFTNVCKLDKFPRPAGGFTEYSHIKAGLCLEETHPQ
jgi:hypothetical protein